jgi:predicted secreted protein
VDKVYDGRTTATVTLSDNRVSGDVLTDSYATVTFADKNVGPAKAVSVSGISISGPDAANYSLSNTTASTAANITPQTLNVTATGANKVYDGTTADPGVTLSDNRVPGDVLTDSYTTATFADKNVGTGKAVTVSGITISGTDAGNYQLASTTVTATANITALAITVTATANTKTYDGTPSAAAAPTISPALATGDTSGFTETYATKDVGTNETLTPSGTVSDGNGGNNYSVTFVSSATGAITARPLTVTPTGVNKVYDGTTTATVTLSDNRVPGDVLTDSYATATFADPNVGTNKTVFVIGIAVSGPDAGNYALTNTSANTTANITPAPIGPVTSDVTATPNPTNTGPRITALESDANTGDTNVTAAEYFIGAPGTSGKGIAMKASNGKFNNPNENVVATMSSTTFNRLANRSWTIYVHGKDATGRWGSFVTTTFIKDTVGPVTSNIEVTPNSAGAAPTVTATVSDAATGDSNVVAAEYFIDIKGAAGKGTAIAIGSPSPTVGISFVLNSAAFAKLKPGKHTIYIHGKDAAGNWGKLVAVTFTKSAQNLGRLNDAALMTLLGE